MDKFRVCVDFWMSDRHRIEECAACSALNPAETPDEIGPLDKRSEFVLQSSNRTTQENTLTERDSQRTPTNR